MAIKKCTKCNCEKCEELFPWKNKKQNKRIARCKDCHNLMKREYNAKIRLLKKSEEPEMEIPDRSNYCNKCETVKPSEEFYASWRDRKKTMCKKCNAERSRKRHLETYEQNKQYYRDYYQKNREYRLEWQNNYRKTDAGRASRKKFISKPEQRARKAQAKRIKDVLNYKNLDKCKTTLKYIGCNAKELKEYLESQFLEGMNWDNYGFYGWHIDHIKPISSFNLEDEEQMKECFHYTNLQPLWAEDNLKKGASVE